MGPVPIILQARDRAEEVKTLVDALKDFESGIVFSRVDLVCNCVPVDKTVPALEKLKADPNTAEIMDLMTHEQYFWPFYVAHLPDHAQRLDTAQHIPMRPGGELTSAGTRNGWRVSGNRRFAIRHSPSVMRH